MLVLNGLMLLLNALDLLLVSKAHSALLRPAPHELVLLGRCLLSDWVLILILWRPVTLFLGHTDVILVSCPLHCVFIIVIIGRI